MRPSSFDDSHGPLLPLRPLPWAGDPVGHGVVGFEDDAPPQPFFLVQSQDVRREGHEHLVPPDLHNVTWLTVDAGQLLLVKSEGVQKLKLSLKPDR